MRVGARFGEPCYYPFVTGLEGFPSSSRGGEGGERDRQLRRQLAFRHYHLASRRLRRCSMRSRRRRAAGTPSSRAPKQPTTRFRKACARWSTSSSAREHASLKVTGGRRKMHSTIGSMKVHDTENADGYEAEHRRCARTPNRPQGALRAAAATRSLQGYETRRRAAADRLPAGAPTRPELPAACAGRRGRGRCGTNRCTRIAPSTTTMVQRRRMRRLTVEHNPALNGRVKLWR